MKELEQRVLFLEYPTDQAKATKRLEPRHIRFERQVDPLAVGRDIRLRMHGPGALEQRRPYLLREVAEWCSRWHVAPVVRISEVLRE
ncbi:MAG: hypothetical protein KF837_44320 [Labilithrix sp.]|nr:hypothetical protein [Labilithrix sp.]